MYTKQDKRKQRRISTHCRVYLENGISGYLVDITNKGAKIWLDKHKDFTKESLCIGIRYIKNEQQKIYHFNLNCIWHNSNKSHYFNEIGCQFHSLSVEQEKQLEELIDFFENSIK